MNWIEISALVSWVAMTLPCYVLGRRRGVSRAWIAFIPLVGSVIVLLWSMPASLWFLLGLVVPVVLLVILAVELPRRHGRSGWWTLGFLVPYVDLLVLYVYAFTSPERLRTSVPAPTAA
jgi:hypothetical protein